MDNLNKAQATIEEKIITPKIKGKIVILRWGHRPQRDARLTTHVALTARALGASGFVLSDVADESIKQTVENIRENFGGDFTFDMGISWRSVVRNWKKAGGAIIHLTAYGENIQNSNIIERLREVNRDFLIIVGSQKVPAEFYFEEVSDYNVAVGNQPHSECAALAIFLDRFFQGQTLGMSFEHAKKKIIPQTRGKKVE
ncbi:MAG: tRNA (cytidine(56)-2'-O)-methyltransferase [Crenarchaeota archaeon]|nr:tRNA (cytidine(56)-2'-O)-methyltransferase [Thermoproteota archaeon]